MIGLPYAEKTMTIC